MSGDLMSMGRFVPWDVLSHGTFCPMGYFVCAPEQEPGACGSAFIVFLDPLRMSFVFTKRTTKMNRL